MSSRAFIELLDGKGAHASPLACVEDLPAEAAARRVNGFPHSIVDLVLHLNYWMDYDLRRIRGERPPYPEHATESWPAPACSSPCGADTPVRAKPEPTAESRNAPSARAVLTEAQWSKAVESFRVLLRQVEELAQSDPAALVREVEPIHSSHAERASSLGDLLWQTLVHNSYHVGQIAILRRMLNLWPPRAGGDTW